MKEFIKRLRKDLETVVSKAKPMKGIGVLKDHLKPFDKKGIDPKEVTILNHRDADGYLSGIIVNQYLGGGQMVDVQHNEPIDKKLIEDKVVFMVDFSLKPKEMMELADMAKRVIWIDHHSGAIDQMKAELSVEELSRLEGICCSGPAGCELTWMCMYGTYKDIPPTVLIAGAYDAFRYNSDDSIINRDPKLHDEFILPMHFAYKKQYTDQSDSALQAMVESKEGAIPALEDLLVEGKAIWSYMKKQANENVRNCGFLVELEGVKFVGMFNNTRGSAEFGDAVDQTEAEAMMLLMPNNDGITMSFYHDGNKHDMSKVAKSLGGGGHKGSAGSNIDYKKLNDILKDIKPLTWKK